MFLIFSTLQNEYNVSLVGEIICHGDQRLSIMEMDKGERRRGTNIIEFSYNS